MIRNNLPSVASAFTLEEETAVSNEETELNGAITAYEPLVAVGVVAEPFVAVEAIEESSREPLEESSEGTLEESVEEGTNFGHRCHLFAF